MLNQLSRPDRAPLFANLRQDALASVVVFLVALPLCMGVALASGVPPALGLITGIIGGLVVGAFSGSPLQVSGPAAGLTVLVYEIVHSHGLGMLGVIVLAAGLLQVLAGVLKLGQYFRAISPAVVNGMLAGIGVLIIAGQFHVMVDDKPKGDGLTNLLSIPGALWKGLVPLDGSAHHLAAAIGVVTIAVMVGWGFMPKRWQLVPAPLVAIALATVIAAIFQLPIRYVSVPESLASVVQWTTWANFAHLLEGPVLGSAVAVAVIASAETLLSATAVDQMHQGPRTRYDRELIAQGIGNTLCGALGALPMTGVIVRSSANVAAGAKTRLSAMLHGAWILAFILFLPHVLAKIPTSALAAMLVFTGFKLVSLKAIKGLWSVSRAEVFIYAATLIGIVSTNLLEGVILGVILSLGRLLLQFSRLELHLAVSSEQHEAVLSLKGAATVIKLPQLARQLEAVPAGATLTLEVAQLRFIDHACLELLKNWERQHVAAGGTSMIVWSSVYETFRLRRSETESRAQTGTSARQAAVPFQ